MDSSCQRKSMEQSVRKKQIIILAAGGLITFALVAAHYISPISRRLAANADIELVLLNKERPMLFIYRSFSKTVNAVQLPGRAARSGSAYQRACEILKTFYGNGVPAQEPAYIEVQAPDMEAFENLINTWRARPAQLHRLIRWLRGLKKNDATNLSVHDIALLALELSRINSSNFIKEDFDNPRAGAVSNAYSLQTAKTRPADPPRAVGPASAAETVRIEILNASGRKDLAVLVTNFLRKKGFDVINFGTYGSIEKQTKIVNCSGNIDTALGIRDVLALGGLEIYSKLEKPAIAQVRIILGADFDDSKIEKTERGIR